MVEFLSFFLVLTTGSKPIELTVTPPVARVEVLLDGRQIATLTGRPWAFMCDFGVEPEPRELVIIGRNAEGREIDRATQWINLGVQPARARMSFKEDDEGRIRYVGLSWESIGQKRPEAIEITFDGEPLAVEDPRHVPLPDYDPDVAHFVGATVRFADQVTRLDASFGGEYGEELSTELTALPVMLAPGTRMPSRKNLGSWFLKDGRALEVQAVDRGPADVLVVRDPAAQRRLEQLAAAAIARWRRPLSGAEIRRRREESRPPPGDVLFSHNTHLRFVAPYAVPLYAQGGITSDLFARSEWHGAEDTGLLWLTHQVQPRGFPFELAEAVAIAGMTAHASSRRRAVLVILDGEPDDASDYSPAAVRKYLSLLRVPLDVWTTAPGTRSAWSGARYVGDRPRRPGSVESFHAAVRDLDRDLQRQRIVWLRGRHLPHEVELSVEARSRLSFAGAGDAELEGRARPVGVLP